MRLINRFLKLKYSASSVSFRTVFSLTDFYDNVKNQLTVVNKQLSDETLFFYV